MRYKRSSKAFYNHRNKYFKLKRKGLKYKQNLNKMTIRNSNKIIKIRQYKTKIKMS